MEEGQDLDVPPHRIPRMPETAIGGKRRRGDGSDRGRGDTGAWVDGEGGRSEPGPAGQHVGEASGSVVPQTPGASTQGYVDDTLPDFGSLSASFFDGILNPASLEQQFDQEVQPPFPVDLNEPASDMLGDFSFALGGTPPSAFVGVYPQLDHDIPTEEGHEELAAEAAPEPRRGRKVPRRQGCGTGGHM
ncbi:hypothetical protein PIB30_091087 [Stylosanthes scabra]|uniref:Uncharacterized protein n=1 Tax=Stylosanthes scabra TaxID=79078 RepID=A0ABU6SWW5_9FABA|nr:hypothetical protein [Stylosanthes scabra]